MGKPKSSSKRIAKNSILLYVRMLIVMSINLVAVRLVLKALGVEDYGIYNVIAGFVTSLSCITSALSASTQRFYSIAQGEKNETKLQAIYSTSIRINVIIVVALLIFAETIGLWFVNEKLVIPESRLLAANFVYQATIISFASVFMQTPFSAAVIAHEDMGVFAAISLIECFMKFGAAAILFYISVDNLIVYSILLAAVSVFGLLAYFTISKKRYSECHYFSKQNKELRKQMVSFSGWTLVTSIASICMYQANTILVNLYFGPIVNASRGIALQLNSILSSFTASFLLAVRPPMMKLYAEGRHRELNLLFGFSNKFIYYLMLIISIPMILEMDIILKIWLDHTSSQTVLFSRLIVIYGMILALNNPISYIIQATGHVKRYCLTVEVFTIACMPITWILFILGFNASSTFVAMIICIILSHISRMYCLKKFYPEVSLREYCVDFLGRAIFISIIVLCVALLVHLSIHNIVIKLILVVLSTAILTLVLLYLLGISKGEKQIVKEQIGNLINRFIKHE